MAIVSPSNLDLEEKKRLWKEKKHKEYLILTQNKNQFFYYFYKNNDIFGLITKEDQKILKGLDTIMSFKTLGILIGSISVVLFVDKVILRFLKPGWKIQRFRPLIFLFKYWFLPGVGLTAGAIYFQRDEADLFLNMRQKYNFTLEDYERGNNILERALEVNRLQQLLEKRDKFDWTGVPDFTSFSAGTSSPKVNML